MGSGQADYHDDDDDSDDDDNDNDDDVKDNVDDDDDADKYLLAPLSLMLFRGSLILQ